MTVGYKKCLDETKTKFVLVEIEIPDGVKQFTPEHVNDPDNSMVQFYLLLASFKGIPSDFNKNFPPKSRAEKAKVTKIHGGGKVAYSLHDNKFEYKEGMEVIPDKFDERDKFACSNGIHFFKDKKDAIEYQTSHSYDKDMKFTDAIVDEEIKTNE